MTAVALAAMAVALAAQNVDPGTAELLRFRFTLENLEKLVLADLAKFRVLTPQMTSSCFPPPPAPEPGQSTPFNAVEFHSACAAGFPKLAQALTSSGISIREYFVGVRLLSDMARALRDLDEGRAEGVPKTVSKENLEFAQQNRNAIQGAVQQMSSALEAYIRRLSAPSAPAQPEGPPSGTAPRSPVRTIQEACRLSALADERHLENYVPQALVADFHSRSLPALRSMVTASSGRSLGAPEGAFFFWSLTASSGMSLGCETEEPGVMRLGTLSAGSRRLNPIWTVSGMQESLGTTLATVRGRLSEGAPGRDAGEISFALLRENDRWKISSWTVGGRTVTIRDLLVAGR